MQREGKLKEFYGRLDELYRLRCIEGLLSWDQQVCMPEGAAGGRADQLEIMGRLIHHKFTDSVLYRLVSDLWNEQGILSADDRTNVRETKRLLDRAMKLPEDFIAEKTREASISYVTWTSARPENDFAAVKPHLEKIVELSCREADLVGFRNSRYDALLDVYEPHALLQDVKPLLLKLAEKLAPLIPGICAKLPAVSEIEGIYPEEVQFNLCARVAADIGYDFRRGRLDKTHHPFESSVGPGDVRITTRYNARNYLSSVFTVLHEAGHALYEQGLPAKYKGTPLGSAVSLGIHESQSRLWENVVGRSQAYAVYLYNLLEEYLPEEYRETNPEEMWQQNNRVKPSLIRVEADEVTYSLHVVIRMLIEEDLINGALKVTDLPAAWDGLYEKYLGIRPPDYKDGLLQDVHWYAGMLGYFPTYALGNLYGALIVQAARRALPDLDSQVRNGDFRNLTRWLRANIHEQGMRHTGTELIKNISGQEINAEPFLGYICEKFSLRAS